MGKIRSGLKKGLIGYGNLINKGITKYKQDRAYKSSPEYKQKVLADLKLQNKIRAEQLKAQRTREKFYSSQRRQRKNQPQNLFYF